MTTTDEPIFVEDVAGSARPAAYYLAESRDGLYVPYVLRTPADEGRFPEYAHACSFLRCLAAGLGAEPPRPRRAGGQE